MLKVIRIFVLFIAVALSGLLLLGDNQCLAASEFSGKIGVLVKNAEAYSRQGNHSMALALYNQAIHLQPSNTGLYYRRAAMFGRYGDYLSAVNDLTRVIRADERNKKRKFPAARKFRAECFATLGLLEKAVAEYKLILRLNPKSGKLWYYLAETYAYMQRQDLAMSAIQKGLATKTHWSGNLIGLQARISTGEKISLHRPFSN